MELILFIGIQASGKSSFYREHFFNTHVRINLDMLKTHHREEVLFKACLEGKIPVVVDKMNLTREQRALYIHAAKAAGFQVKGYFFDSRPADAVYRNARRSAEESVPEKAIFGASKQLQLPSRSEGFDELFRVRVDGKGGFSVEEWNDEI